MHRTTKTVFIAALVAAAMPISGALPAIGAIIGTGTATDFESFATGSPHGQAGWSSLGSNGQGCAAYDHKIVANGAGAPSAFGARSLRMSNAVTSGCFGDQTFSASVANEAGEASAQGGGMSGGARQRLFEASWSFASTTGAAQPGLVVVASPDRGDGARMSWVSMEDQAGGLQVGFYDYQAGTAGVCDGAFVHSIVASGLDRASAHRIDVRMVFVDDRGNDVVVVTVDDQAAHVGTSWEDYFRDCEGNPSRTVDSVLFRTGGAAAPATMGNGFLIDALDIFTSVP